MTTSRYIFPEDISRAPPGESASAYGTGKRRRSKIYVAASQVTFVAAPLQDSRLRSKQMQS